jgi:hypothetical protein
VRRDRDGEVDDGERDGEDTLLLPSVDSRQLYSNTNTTHLNTSLPSFTHISSAPYTVNSASYTPVPHPPSSPPHSPSLHQNNRLTSARFKLPPSLTHSLTHITYPYTLPPTYPTLPLITTAQASSQRPAQLYPPVSSAVFLRQPTHSLTHSPTHPHPHPHPRISPTRGPVVP